MDLENFCNCRSDLENLGELQLVIRALLAGGIRELSNARRIRGGGVTSFYRFGVFFQGGSARHADVASIRGSTRQVGRLQVQGHDTSLPPDRGATH